MFEDLTGRVFGKRTVIGHAGRNNSHNHMWYVKCPCGDIAKVAGIKLKAGHALACPTCTLTSRRADFVKSKLPEYNVWKMMRDRCRNPKAMHYYRYGGRGIKVCDEWMHDFLAFHAHVGSRPTDKHQLDRIDNDGNYAPGNVRWVTPEVNMQNRNVPKGRKKKTSKECQASA